LNNVEEYDITIQSGDLLKPSMLIDLSLLKSIWIKILNVAEFDRSELEKMVHEEHPLEKHHVFGLQRKAMFL